jgi:hypothetical protein
MTKKSRIPKPDIDHGKRKRASLLSEQSKKDIKIWNEGRITFSFRFFDKDTEEFNCGGIKDSWFLSLLDTLKHISEFTKVEFLSNRSTRLRVHSHSWDQLDHKYDLPGSYMEQLSEDACIQFSVSKANGRIHGFMIENTFFVVWFDPHHNLYAMEQHGGRKTFSSGLSEYEILKQENDELRKENDELWEMLDKKTS